MIAFCFNCGKKQPMVYKHTVRDRRGRKWEVYRCATCGHHRCYAVS